MRERSKYHFVVKNALSQAHVFNTWLSWWCCLAGNGTFRMWTISGEGMSLETSLWGSQCHCKSLCPGAPPSNSPGTPVGCNLPIPLPSPPHHYRHLVSASRFKISFSLNCSCSWYFIRGMQVHVCVCVIKQRKPQQTYTSVNLSKNMKTELD